MLDRQEVRMNVKKIGDDLVVMIVPNYKNDGKTIQLSGTPDEVDNGFFNELKNFQDSLTEGLKTEVIEGEAEEDETDKKQDSKKLGSDNKTKPEVKKPTKKVEKKKVAVKTVEPVKEEKPMVTEEEKVEEPKQEEPKVESSHIKIDELMAKGKEAFENRNYDGAVDFYTEAYELNREDKKVEQALSNARKWQQAIARLKPATE